MALVRRLAWGALAVVVILAAFAGGWLSGRLGLGSTVDQAALTDLERRFSEQMRGSALVGYFTVAGRDDHPARPDRYDIVAVEKIGDDLWRFSARMRHDTFDVTVPVAEPVRWIGEP